MLLRILFCVALAALVFVVAAGLVNLFLRSPRRVWRSNLLMRARVLVQFILVLLLIAAGVFAGAR